MKLSAKSKLSAIAILALVALAGCYRMPTEDDYSVLPMTNNPEFTHEGQSQLTPPGLSY